MDYIDNAEQTYDMDYGKRNSFPLRELSMFRGNMYEITAAASRRAFQIASVDAKELGERKIKAVSLAAIELFCNKVNYKLGSPE